MGGYGGVAFYGMKVKTPKEDKFEALINAEKSRIQLWQTWDGSFDPDFYVVDRETIIDQDDKDNLLEMGDKTMILDYVLKHRLISKDVCGFYLVKHEIY